MCNDLTSVCVRPLQGLNFMKAEKHFSIMVNPFGKESYFHVHSL